LCFPTTDGESAGLVPVTGADWGYPELFPSYPPPVELVYGFPLYVRPHLFPKFFSFPAHRRSRQPFFIRSPTRYLVAFSSSRLSAHPLCECYLVGRPLSLFLLHYITLPLLLQIDLSFARALYYLPLQVFARTCAVTPTFSGRGGIPVPLSPLPLPFFTPCTIPPA